MFKILDRYIISSLIKTTALVFVALMGLRIFISLFGELNQLGMGSYGLKQAIEFMLFSLPLYMYQLFPNIALLGTLMSLGLLAQNSELTIMRAAGMSLPRIFFAVIQGALIMIVVMSLVGEWLAPHLSTYAEHRKGMQKMNGQMISTETGIWLRNGGDFIHIDQNIDGKKLINITRYHFDDQHRLMWASAASDAVRQPDGWEVHNIKTSFFGQDHVTVTTTPQQFVKMTLIPKLMGDLMADEMPLDYLKRQIHLRQHSGLNTSDYELAFWTRVLQPLTTLVMVLLAVPFIFGPLRSVPMGLRILTGVMVGLAFYIFNRFFGPFSIVYQVPAFIAAIVPPLLFALLALILMLKRR